MAHHEGEQKSWEVFGDIRKKEVGGNKAMGSESLENCDTCGRPFVQESGKYIGNCLNMEFQPQKQGPGKEISKVYKGAKIQEDKLGQESRIS